MRAAASWLARATVVPASHRHWVLVVVRPGGTEGKGKGQGGYYAQGQGLFAEFKAARCKLCLDVGMLMQRLLMVTTCMQAVHCSKQGTLACFATEQQTR